MEFELWWLLVIPVLFSLGWLAARLEQKAARQEARQHLSRYFVGVNLVLSGQPDKAIDSLLEVAANDPAALELQFALGSWFRRKGELDRAIRVHEFLCNSPELSEYDKTRAQLNLGIDFLRAGILDRAESAFLVVMQSQNTAGLTPTSPENLAIEAAKQLLALYELEKDWHKAIAQAQILKEMGEPAKGNELSHFFCELGWQCLQNERWDEARTHLHSALLAHSGCVRATLLLGELAKAQGDLATALGYWQQAMQQNPWYLPLVGEAVWQAYVALNRSQEGLAFLQEYATAYPSVDWMKVVIEAVASLQGDAAALAYVQSEVTRRPNLLGLNVLLHLDAPQQNNASLVLVRDLMQKHIERLQRYRCQYCGFAAKQFYWQCPGCAQWDSMVPRRAEELVFSDPYA